MSAVGDPGGVPKWPGLVRLTLRSPSLVLDPALVLVEFTAIGDRRHRASGRKEGLRLFLWGALKLCGFSSCAYLQLMHPGES